MILALLKTLPIVGFHKLTFSKKSCDKDRVNAWRL